MGKLEDYSDNEFCAQLRLIVSALLADVSCVPTGRPRAFLLGGQSGAGKTTLHRLLQDSLDGKRDRRQRRRIPLAASSVLRDRRALRRRWTGAYGGVGGAHGRSRCGLAVRDGLQPCDRGDAAHVRSAAFKTAAFLRERGYEVSLALMAVKPEISLISCQLRYEQMRLAGTEPPRGGPPRTTSPSSRPLSGT